jgi:hypothetical protein
MMGEIWLTHEMIFCGEKHDPDLYLLMKLFLMDEFNPFDWMKLHINCVTIQWHGLFMIVKWPN